MMDIQIVDLRILTGNKSIKAFVDLRIGDIILKDFRVMEENGRAHVKVPYQTHRDRSGQLKFRSIIILPPGLAGEIEATVLNAFYQRRREVESGRSNS